ncbi:ATP-binding protein [Cronobacter dublinensis]
MEAFDTKKSSCSFLCLLSQHAHAPFTKEWVIVLKHDYAILKYLFCQLVTVFTFKDLEKGVLMMVNFSLSNAFSFRDAQNLSMLAVSSSKDDINQANVVTLKNERVLKSALIFGANASGKSNLIKTLSLMRDIVLHSVQAIESSITKNVIPFLLSEAGPNSPTEMEVVFISEGVKYRYGISLLQGVIKEEWLYYTPSSRETILFERDSNSIEINKAAFGEANLFVKDGLIQKTRADVPFISVVAGFDGEHSKRVVNWFSDIAVISGSNESAFTAITLKLINESSDFKSWIKKILPAFQISDIYLDEVAPELPFNDIKTDDDNLKNLFSSIANLAKTQKMFSLRVIKKTANGEISVPIDFESEGTKKIVYLLGPIYNAMKSGGLLLVDEFDSKFHTLLSKFLFALFHEQSEHGSQIIAAVQDVNLMSTEFFRRDQIWFVDKDIKSGGSNIYSLVEYKEKQRTLKASYGHDYLTGAFDAIPLFNDYKHIDVLMSEE